MLKIQAAYVVALLIVAASFVGCGEDDLAAAASITGATTKPATPAGKTACSATTSCPAVKACEAPVECGPDGLCRVIPGNAPKSVLFSCDDGDVCTAGDHCDGAGNCKGGDTPNKCNDGNECTEDKCVLAKGCENKAYPIGAECVGNTDGDATTIGDKCVDAGGGKVICKGTPSTDCVTNADCKEYALGKVGCGKYVCVTVTVDGKEKGQCLSEYLTIDDKNPCTIDYCDPTNNVVVHKPAVDGQTCEDGKFCTVNQGCKAGTCQGGAVAACDDGKPCSADSCDIAADHCVNSSGDCNDKSPFTYDMCTPTASGCAFVPVGITSNCQLPEKGNFNDPAMFSCMVQAFWKVPNGWGGAMPHTVFSAFDAKTLCTELAEVSTDHEFRVNVLVQSKVDAGFFKYLGGEFAKLIQGPSGLVQAQVKVPMEILGTTISEDTDDYGVHVTKIPVCKAAIDQGLIKIK